MSSFQLLEDTTFILKRLILVNSAGHAYSEIMLDNHLAMFGSNNVGKTASLAATKLLLFPENNFRNCESKFRFVGDDGPYSGEASHGFYFPSSSSFLALEVKNDLGNFCMVLYRPAANTSVTRLDYNRVFIPVPYEQLRPLFWDEKSSEEGQFASEISVEKLLDFTKQNKGREISEPKRIAEVMFGSYGTAEGKFCVLPLKDISSDSISAFRDIYNLAFASASNSKETLPSAIAALIEMQRGRDKEKTDLNLNKTYLEYQELVKDKNRLVLLDSVSGEFNFLHGTHKSLNERIEEYSKNFHALHRWLRDSRNNIGPRVQENQVLVSSASEILAIQTNSLTELNKKEIYSKGQYELKEKEFIKKEKKLISWQMKMGAYHGQELTEILKILDEDIVGFDESIQALGSIEANVNTLAQKKAELQQKQRQYDNIELILKNESHQIWNQLSEHAVQVLNAIDPRLNSIAIELESSAKDTIEGFTNLFAFNESTGDFFLSNVLLDEHRFNSFDPNKTRIKNEEKLLNLKKEITKLRAKINELEGYLRQNINKVYTDEEKIKLIQKREQYQADRELLAEKEVIQAAYKDAKNECAELKLIWENISTEKHIQEIAFQEAEAIFNEHDTVRQQLQSHIEVFNDIQAQLRFANIERLLVPDTALIGIEEVVTALPQGHSQIKSQAFKLSDMAKGLNKEFDRFKDKFQRFMIDVPEIGIEAHTQDPSMMDFLAPLYKYAMIFSTLEYQKKDFSQKVTKHNNEIRAQVEEIVEANAQLQRQIKTINTQLNGHRVSNLSNITLDLETIKDFDSLRYTVEKYNVSGDTLPDESFYTSLLTFFGKNQNSNGRLKMVNLIKSIGYKYSINDGPLVSKSQSKGTTTTITAFVSSILLAEIKEVNTKVHLPIVVDEVAALDADNSEAVVKHISEQGFSIFCATPKFEAHIANCTGRHILIDQYRPDKVLLNTCQLHILPRHVSVFGGEDAD
ncbi:coiled-coil domain-containing protein [Acinetobacter oleivorans]|uniref:hypothetical protein n=1 Tax=Acinetobacter oleivorans TaxID=1148157 RepID=UPI00226D005B|nr:hypothetical protein [Acinetobacter oleivorans]